MKKSIAASVALYVSCFIFQASGATLTWNGADGACWSDEGVWLDESSAAATITDEGIALDNHKTYALLTAGKNSSNQAMLKDADKLTVPDSLKSKGWRVRTVKSDDGDTTVELYCQRGLFILIR